jgi:hypothetical protein
VKIAQMLGSYITVQNNLETEKFIPFFDHSVACCIVTEIFSQMDLAQNGIVTKWVVVAKGTDNSS